MHRLLLAVLLPVLALVGLAALVRWAGAATATVAVAGVLVAVAYVAGRRARSALRSTGLVVPALVILAVAAAPPALAADATVSAGSLIGTSIEILVGVLGAPIAAALTLLIVRMASMLGVDIQAAYRKRLEEMIENGLAEAADRLDKRLDGTLDVNVRSELVAEAADYLVKHGRETVKALGGDPKDRDAMRTIVAARLVRLAA